MAEQKTTTPTSQSAEAFIEAIAAEQIRDDCFALMKLMKKVTGAPPKMWGSSIVGFGQYHYKYESGHEGDACLTGFSPRKQNITVYVMPGFAGHEALSKKLGKYKAGKGCLYIRKLEDVDLDVLEDLITRSVASLRKKYPV